MSTRTWTREAGDILHSYWWLSILRGIVAVLFGIAVLARPTMTAGVLLLMFGAFALASGVLAVIASISLAAHHKQWWTMLIEGLIGIVIGLITFYLPVLTLLAVVVTVAIWAIIAGIFQLAGAFSGFGPTSSRVFLGIAGVLSLILGIWLFAKPGMGFMSLVLLLGIYAIVWGVSEIIFGFQVRRLDRWVQTHARAGV